MLGHLPVISFSFCRNESYLLPYRLPNGSGQKNKSLGYCDRNWFTRREPLRQFLPASHQKTFLTEPDN